MSSRSWGLAVWGVAILLLTPRPGQSQTPSEGGSYRKDAVKALSKRIDGHLAKVWQKAGVTPSPKAEDHVFFRRLNLDLNGRIPTLSQYTDFVDNDDPEKRWEWVDRYLDSPEHPRHFANVWRTIMLGYQTNQQVQFAVPQFEAWLRERIEKNVGLDKTVLQLLTSQQNPNMGFNGQFNQPGSPQLFFLANENKAENLAAATSRVFLGVKLECAQCHPHPFAKWKKEQFWEFAAFYSTPANMVRRPGVVPPMPTPAFQPGREILIPGTEKVVKAKFLNGAEPKWDLLSNSRTTLANWVTAKENPYFARAMADHIWSYLMGVSLLEPIMEPSDDSPITHPELLDDLARGLIENNFDAKFLIRAIVHSDAYQRSSAGAKLADKEDYNLFVRMPMRALSPEQIFDSVSVVTRYKDPTPAGMNQPFFNPNQLQTPRAQFLSKFMNQDRRHEPQTSILQALFMMNGKFMAERTKLENNEDLAYLAQSKDYDKSVRSMYFWVLSRPPRPEETQRLAAYLEKSHRAGNLGPAVTDVYWALLNSSEFLLNH